MNSKKTSKKMSHQERFLKKFTLSKHKIEDED